MAIEDSIDRIDQDSLTFHAIVHGEADAADVTTEGGMVPTVAKVIASIMEGGAIASGGMGINVKREGALGDGLHHYLDADGAAAMNAKYGEYGLDAAAGDEHDWAVIQGVLHKASYTGEMVLIPVGTYLTNRPLNVQWTLNPGPNKLVYPQIRRIEGEGVKTIIRGTITVTPEEVLEGKTHGVLELIGESNPTHASCDVQHLVLEMSGGSKEACALLAGDAWCGVTANRCWFRGANGCILKVASTVSYAQLCTRMTNCVFMGNWAPGWMEGPSDWWPSQSVAEASALNFVSGGSTFDNVLFESCVFMGHVGIRSNLATFLSCQFATNPFRPYQYKDAIHIYGGSISLRDSYFEDHDVAVICGAFTTPIRNVLIDGCHFSGVNNFAGSVPRAAIICYPMQWMLGPVTIRNCKIRDDFYTETPIQIDGTDVDIGPMSRAWSEEKPSTGILPIAVQTTNCTGIIRQQIMDTNGYSQGTEEHITKLVKFRDIECELATVKDVKVSRKAETETWGFSIENATGLDVFQFSWIGPTCTYALPWMELDAPAVYIPGGKAIRFGYGVSPFGYAELGPNGVYTVGAYRCNAGNDFYALGNVPSLFSVTLDHTAFAGINALTGHVEAFVQFPYAKVLSVMLEVLTPFAGADTVAASCGPENDLQQYIADTDVKLGGNFAEESPNKTQSRWANVSIRVRLTATGANLSALTAGSLRVNVLAVYGINS